MSILDILFRNSGQKIRTLLPQNQSVPAGFRGTLEHSTELCIGCSACAYVCSPGAISLDVQPGEVVTWQYQALRCTYCGRCAEYCPTHAIQLVAAPHAAALAFQAPAAETSGLVTRHLVKTQFCARCGKQYSAIPLPILQQLMERDIASGERGKNDIASLMHLCEKCRQRVTSEQLKDSFIGSPNREGR